jgi:RNA polymerase sigma-70 factor (ECF subfamily)
MSETVERPWFGAAESNAVEPRVGSERPAFAELYREHFDFVWRTLRHLGVVPAAIDDTVQEVWLAVHRNLPSFEGRSRPTTWLFGIALNVTRNQRRRQRPPQASELLDDLPTRNADPEHMLAAQDAWALVMSYLDTLDELARAIFVSALLENLTPAETAEVLGVDVEIVYRRVRALRRAFQRRLQQRDEDSK